MPAFTETNLCSESLQISRNFSLRLFVSSLLVNQMLVDLVVGQESVLGLENLHFVIVTTGYIVAVFLQMLMIA